MAETKGSKALRKALGAMNVRETSRRLKIARTMFYHWMDGRSKPSAKMKTKLRDEFGIPVEDWLDADERKALGL